MKIKKIKCCETLNSLYLLLLLLVIYSYFQNMDYIYLVSPLVDAGLVSPSLKFGCKNNILHFCEVMGIGLKIKTSGLSRKVAKMAAFKILYDHMVSERLAGDIQVSPSGSFQLSKMKNSNGSGAKN